MDIFDRLFGGGERPQRRGPAAYHAYTTRFDRVTDARGLDSVLGGLSAEAGKALDEAWDVFQSGLQPWRTSAHIAGLNASADIRRVVSDTVLQDSVFAFLVDQSGSMRGQNMLLAAAAIDVAQNFVCGLGGDTEIFGFTTTTWQGGKSRKQWIAKGRPGDPGRLCDLLHIVYKSVTDGNNAGTHSWSLRPMLRPDLPKENIDGEAVEWAASRLRGLPHKRKFLIVISDGAPVDDSTFTENDAAYLDRHLRQVIAHLTAEASVTLAAIGIGHDAAAYYGDGIVVQTPEDLGLTLIGKIRDLIIA